MILTLSLFSWILVILLFNYIDYGVTHNGGKPDYVKYFITRGMCAILHGGLMLIVNEDSHTNYSYLSAWRLLIVWLPYLLFQTTSFWLIYEIVRNIWTHRDMLYYDHKEGDSGSIDRFFKWAGPTFHALCKLIALSIMVLSIIVIYHRNAIN